MSVCVYVCYVCEWEIYIKMCVCAWYVCIHVKMECNVMI